MIRLPMEQRSRTLLGADHFRRTPDLHTSWCHFDGVLSQYTWERCLDIYGFGCRVGT